MALPRRTPCWPCRLALLSLAALGAPAGAQPYERPGDEPLPAPLPGEDMPPGLRLPELEPSPPGSERLSGAAWLVVTEFRVTGATAFPESELAELTAPYENRPISAEDLQALRDAITRHYVEAGYVSSGAIVPEQDASAGVVEIRVVEGRLARIEVEGLRHFRESYVRNRLERASGTPLSVVTLEERLQILQQDGRIRRVDAGLFPGERPGDAVLRVSLEEETPWWARLEADNHEPPSNGGTAGRVRLGHENVLGLGDRLFASASFTESLESDPPPRGSYSIGYEIPVTARDTTLGLAYDYGESEVVEAPFDQLDISSDSQTVAVYLRQPLLRDLRRSLDASLRLEKRESQTFLFGEPFQFAPGPDSDGESRVTVVRAGLDWLYRDLAQVIAARSQFSVGLDLLDATEQSGREPDGQYLAWLGRFQWLRRFDELWAVELLLRIDGQLATSSLLSLEQFSVGGHGTVRGYRESELVRDNGVAGSLELRLPLWSDAKGNGLQLAAFGDMGQAWNRSRKAQGCQDPTSGDPTECVGTVSGERRTLSSVGLGLRFRLAHRVEGEIYVAEALRDVETPPDRDLQDSGIHFRLAVTY